MKVVVLIGPESSGKSTLGKALAEHFGAPLVGEYVREFIEAQQRDTCYADISTIAREQLQREQDARAKRPALLLLDTHLLSNKLWSEVLFGKSPPWLETALQEQHYDLIGLLSPAGLPWQADGQRCQPALAERQLFHQQLADWLHAHHQPVLQVEGSWQLRYEQLKSAIEALLQGSPASPAASGQRPKTLNPDCNGGGWAGAPKNLCYPKFSQGFISQLCM